MARRIFITGASGFLGRALAAHFGARGDTVAGVDLIANPERDVVAGDVAEAGAWQAAAAGADVLVHTAAVVSNAVGHAEQWRVNVLGTRRALDAAVAGGVPRFVHFSSVRAFGDHGYPPGVSEQHPVRPHGSPYVDTKVAGEQVVLQAHAAGEVAATVLRPADVYGPGSRPWTLLPLEAIRAGRFLLPAMGRGAFTPLFVDDLVAGVAAAADDAGVGQVITLAPEAAVPAREFFAHYFRMLGRPGPRCAPTPVAVALAAAVSTASRAPTEVNPETMRYLARPGGYSVAKAARLLGWRPQVGLDEGMARTERWLRAERLLG